MIDFLVMSEIKVHTSYSTPTQACKTSNISPEKSLRSPQPAQPTASHIDTNRFQACTNGRLGDSWHKINTKNSTNTRDGYMGRMVYLPNVWLIFMIHVGI